MYSTQVDALQTREENAQNAQNSAQSADAVQAQHSLMEKQHADFQAGLQQQNEKMGANAPSDAQLSQIKQEVQNAQQANKNNGAAWCWNNCGGNYWNWGYSDLYSTYYWYYLYYAQLYNNNCYGSYWSYCYYGNYYGNSLYNYYYW